MTDATFEDGTENPLRLIAASADDVKIMSALVQDAVAQNSEISWTPKSRRFAMLINRFRWEDKPAAEAQHRAFERVQAVLEFDDVTAVRAKGLDAADKDLVFAILALEYLAKDDGTAQIDIIVSGDGVISLEAEAVNITLADVSRPYLARAKTAPHHPVDTTD